MTGGTFSHRPRPPSRSAHSASWRREGSGVGTAAGRAMGAVGAVLLTATRLHPHS